MSASLSQVGANRRDNLLYVGQFDLKKVSLHIFEINEEIRTKKRCEKGELR